MEKEASVQQQLVASNNMMERVSDSDLSAKPSAAASVENSLKNDEEAAEMIAGSDLLRMNTGLLPFPESLMSLLDSNKEADIIRWLPDGDAFCLVPATFAERVLDKYFQGSKFESFTRKLNRWGFKRVAGQKVPPNTIAYYHKDFIRGKPRLLKNMNGGKAKCASAKEKMMREKQKNEDDQNASLLALSQYQNTAKLDLMNHGGIAVAPSTQGLLGSFDHNQLRMLEMNSLSLDQEIQNRKLQQMLLANTSLQQHFFDSKLSTMQHQEQQQAAMSNESSEAQQMAAMLRHQNLMLAMRDNASSTGLTQNQWFNAAQANLPIGPSINQLQFSGFQGNQASFASGAELSPARRLMLAQQQQQQYVGLGSGSPNPSNNNNPMTAASAIQRMMESRNNNVGNNISNNNNHLQLQQQLLLEQQRQLALASSTPSQPTSGSSIGGGGTPSDRQLLELYLLQQQHRNSGGSLPPNFNNSDTNR